MIHRDEIMKILGTVTDPEIPVLTITDLGIVREVIVDEADKKVEVIITPTYSGCPAMDVISIGIRMALAGNGFTKIDIKEQLSPAWTTDLMTETGKQKLKEYGIAPPVRKANNPLALFEEEKVACPRCGSEETELISRFGPTSCKAMYKCKSCLEPFEHFKCH